MCRTCVVDCTSNTCEICLLEVTHLAPLTWILVACSSCMFSSSKHVLLFLASSFTRGKRGLKTHISPATGPHRSWRAGCNVARNMLEWRWRSSLLRSHSWPGSLHSSFPHPLVQIPAWPSIPRWRYRPPMPDKIEVSSNTPALRYKGVFHWMFFESHFLLRQKQSPFALSGCDVSREVLSLVLVSCAGNVICKSKV